MDYAGWLVGPPHWHLIAQICPTSRANWWSCVEKTLLGMIRYQNKGCNKAIEKNTAKLSSRNTPDSLGPFRAWWVVALLLLNGDSFYGGTTAKMTETRRAVAWISESLYNGHATWTSKLRCYLLNQLPETIINKWPVTSTTIHKPKISRLQIPQQVEVEWSRGPWIRSCCSWGTVPSGLPGACHFASLGDFDSCDTL